MLVAYVFFDVAAVPVDVSIRRSGGVWFADLTWSGATADDVDVYRDHEMVATVASTGSYTDTLGRPRAGTTFLYKVCAAGTETCSKEQTVTIAAEIAASPMGTPTAT